MTFEKTTSSMKNFIVGYGSLISSESRKVTGLSSDALPVWIHKYERSWSASFPEIKFCALAVKSDTHKKMNAVLFECPDLESFDKREWGYTRTKLNPDLVEMYVAHSLKPEGHYWIYITNEERCTPCSQENLIWQSYVDVCLTGCLEYSELFVADFIRHTTGWQNQFWANDRHSSEYLKALKNFKPDKIDLILKAYEIGPENETSDNKELAAYVRSKLNGQNNS